MIGDYFKLAFGNLRHRGIRSWLTILGIFIGIAAVVSLISLGSGLKMAINLQFGISATEMITIQAGGLNAYGPPGSGVINPLTIDDIKEIEKISGVKRALRRNLESGKLEFNDKVVFGFAMNVPDGEDRDFAYETLDLDVESGRLLKDGDTNKVVLGYNFYVDKVGLGKPIEKGDRILIQDKQFEVVGITKKKGSFIFDNLVLMNEVPLKELMGYGDDVDIIAVQVKDKSLMEKTKQDIEKVLRKTRNVKKGEEDFEVSTPEATRGTVNQVLSGVQIFVGIIAFISIIVGTIGIVNTMTTAVLERRKEIGVMKAVGAKNSQIFMMFFIESGLMGLMGGLVGVIVGMGVGYFGTVGINNFLGATISPDINFIFMGVVLFFSFLIGAIAGIIPAMDAAKQHPVEALRG